MSDIDNRSDATSRANVLKEKYDTEADTQPIPAADASWNRIVKDKEERRTNPHYAEDKDRKRTQNAVQEIENKYQYLGDIADGFSTFRRALGVTSAIKPLAFAGLPVSAMNAVIDRIYYHNSEAANEDLRDAIMAVGLDRAPAAAKAIGQSKYVAPKLQFINGRVIQPFTSWVSTTVFPRMQRVATGAKELLPSWETPTFEERLTQEGRELLAHTGNNNDNP